MTKWVYVTGADRGLGLALTRVFLEQGYNVFAGRFMEDWAELPELAAGNPDRLRVLPLNVADDASVRDAAAAIRRETSSLEVVVNNAGLFRDRSGDIFEELFFDDMRKIYETNSLGPLRVTHSVIDLLVAGEQKLLVNISSEAGSISQCWRTKEYGYSMSKAALNMQSAILQNHLKPMGVKVLAVHPGYVRSYMLGVLNEQATVEPMDSARGIYQLTQDRASLEGPTYVDYQGHPLPW